MSAEGRSAGGRRNGLQGCYCFLCFFRPPDERKNPDPSGLTNYLIYPSDWSATCHSKPQRSRGFIKFLCRRSVGFFSRAFLVFLMKQSKKRRRTESDKLMVKSCSQPVNLSGARPLMKVFSYLYSTSRINQEIFSN